MIWQFLLSFYFLYKHLPFFQCCVNVSRYLLAYVVTYKHDASLLDHSDDSAGAPYSLSVDAMHLSYRLAVSNCVKDLRSHFGLCDLCRSGGTCMGPEVQKVGLVIEMR